MGPYYNVTGINDYFVKTAIYVGSGELDELEKGEDFFSGRAETDEGSGG